MPYKLFKVKGGWKVGKKDGTKMSNGRKYASNKPLKKEKALSQMRTIILSEKNRSPRGFEVLLEAYLDSLNETPKNKLYMILRDFCKFDYSEINKYMDRIESEERVQEILRKIKQNIRNPCEEVKDENEKL